MCVCVCGWGGGGGGVHHVASQQPCLVLGVGWVTQGGEMALSADERMCMCGCRDESSACLIHLSAGPSGLLTVTFWLLRPREVLRPHTLAAYLLAACAWAPLGLTPCGR
jgi:hypothetical protein